MKRRNFIKQSGLLLSFGVAGQSILMSPAQARINNLPLQTLNKAQANTVEILAEAIVPGAAQSGLLHFLDHQLSQPSDADCLLMIRYLGVPPPFNSFYLAALGATEIAAHKHFDKPLSELSKTQLEQFVGLLASDSLSPWQGPPASFFYFVLRSDAVDVTYGTESAFEELNIPYMAHIRPPKNW
jgi:hypothetical protein